MVPRTSQRRALRTSSHHRPTTIAGLRPFSQVLMLKVPSFFPSRKSLHWGSKRGTSEVTQVLAPAPLPAPTPRHRTHGAPMVGKSPASAALHPPPQMRPASAQRSLRSRSRPRHAPGLALLPVRGPTLPACPSLAPGSARIVLVQLCAPARPASQGQLLEMGLSERRPLSPPEDLPPGVVPGALSSRHVPG